MIKTTCSNCTTTLTIEEGTITARVPSNGRRGSLHVPAHTVTADVWMDGDMFMWDCPVCEYADSYDEASA